MRSTFRENSKSFVMLLFASIALAVINTLLEIYGDPLTYGIFERFATYFFAPLFVAIILEGLIDNRRIVKSLKEEKKED